MLDIDVVVERREFDVAIALVIRPGECFSLFGPSGAGKTTLLEAVAGLVEPAEGRIVLGGDVLYRSSGRSGRPVSVAPWRRRVMLLRQTADLFPHLDVARNLVYGADRVDAADLDRLCRAADIEDLLASYPRELSGGQAQRVALARALATEHSALLLDEPYDGLDAPLRRRLSRLVRTEVAASPVPAVLVTHDLAEAQGFADRVGIIERGRLLQVGPPEEVVRRPADRRVAEMVGYRGFVPSGRTLVAVHPDRVRVGELADLGPVFKGRVLESRPVGIGAEVDAVVNGADITFTVADPPGPAGSDIMLTVIDPPILAARPPFQTVSP